VIQSRFYSVNGTKWEARFFNKGEVFPESDRNVSRQGVWARPVSGEWERAIFVGSSWMSVRMTPDVLYFPDHT